MPSTSTQRAVLTKLAALYPDARPELRFTNPYETLVAVMLSAQSTDVQVNKVTPALFLAYPTVEAMAAARVEDVFPMVRSCGFKSKASHIVEACRLILIRHGGKVPGTMEALTALPGVGRKTANVVLANAFGVPTIAVDTHVFRVSNRLGLANAKTVEETERQLMDVIPRRDWIAAHHWLIFHGRRQCHARKPACETCGIALECACFNRPIPSVSAVQDDNSLSEKAAAGSGHGRAKAGALRAADEPNGAGAPDSAAKKENARKVRGTG
ncbi:MAG: endonuclease III [Clostridiales bacterium]|nr:endonuclease III [Clostridiales bacterium]